MSTMTTTPTIYVRPPRVEALNKAAIRVSYETNSPKRTTASELAQYLIDNYLEQAVQKMIADAKK